MKWFRKEIVTTTGHKTLPAGFVSSRLGSLTSKVGNMYNKWDLKLCPLTNSSYLLLVSKMVSNIGFKFILIKETRICHLGPRRGFEVVIEWPNWREMKMSCTKMTLVIEMPVTPYTRVHYCQNVLSLMLPQECWCENI